MNYKLKQKGEQYCPTEMLSLPSHSAKKNKAHGRRKAGSTQF